MKYAGATIGASDDIRGQTVHCFVVLKKRGDFSSSETEAALKREIESTVVQKLGAFARPAAIYVVRALPKTRSGKILRRALHAAAEGRDTGDLSTLEDPITQALKNSRTQEEPTGSRRDPHCGILECLSS